MSFSRRFTNLIVCLTSAWVQAVWCASPTAWEMTAWEDFIKGRFEGVALSRDGRVTLAPRLEKLFSSGQSAVWTIARAPSGDIYLGTGHQGEIFRIRPDGKSETVFSATEPEIFALASDEKGRIFAGASPGGKVYLIEGNKTSEYFDTKAKYVWSLLPAPDSSLYVGTGDEGKIFRITAPGKGEVWYETGQTHVTSLAWDARGRLLAGTEPNGLLYHVSAKEKAFVLYDAAFPEIRSIVAAPDGSVYIAAMGGSVGKKTQEAQQPKGQPQQTPAVSTTVTSITVTDEAQGGIEVKPQQPQLQPAAPQTAVAAPAAPIVEYPGMEKSAIYRIRPDNTVETLWVSKEENAYDLFASQEGLLFSTDSKGRLYRLSADRKVTLLAETRDSEALRLVAAGEAVLLGTADTGNLYRLSGAVGGSGVYESPVKDAGNIARWGQISWRSTSCEGCQLRIQTRSGNSARPDRTWSEWSEPLTEASGSAVTSPNARYIQWRAEFKGSSGRSPELHTMRLAYLPQNNPPVVRSLTVSSQIAAARPKAGGTGTSSSSPTGVYSITVTDTGESGASSLSGTPSQPVNRAATEEVLITWSAEDDDGDELVYIVEFRGQDEREWKQLKANLTETSHKVEADSFADGYYYFRVRASDGSVNPAGEARESELISPPILIDRTPPALKATVEGNRIRLEASDAASPLTRCEWSMNAGAWKALAPEDGIADSRAESFQFRLEDPPPGEKLVVLRCYDSAANAGVARLVLP